jgi:phosphonate transport system substrate-binding protein
VSIRFGVSGLNLLEPAGAFASALAEMCGVALRPWVATDYDHLLEAVGSGSVGVAWMPPLLHARASSGGAVLAALCERKQSLTYRSALVVRHASNFYGVSGPALAGARVAWVDPRSTGGYLFPRMHLTAAGVDPKLHLAGEEFYGSYPRAAMAVVRSEADLCPCHVSESAAGDAQVALAEVRRVVGVADAPLRVLAITDSIPADGIVLGPAVAEKDALLRGLLRLHERIEGAQALRALTNADRLVAPTAEVQHILARLRVHPAAARLS